MFTGTNPSKKEFDVIDEDGDVLGSFDHHADAVACVRSAPWWAGTVRVRRDRSIAQARAQRDIRLRREAAAAFMQAFEYGAAL